MYGFAVWLRNYLFDNKILKSHKFDIPTICVGNLAIGGTGKTPHVEFLIRELSKKYRVAVLSRGYKRNSKGLVIANGNSTAWDIGDEPYQIKSKFSDIVVAVDSNRCRGIEALMALTPAIDIIILDDAFQHRRVKPSSSILLTDYNRLYTKDRILPFGRLRDHKSSRVRADVIIATKTPFGIRDIDKRILINNLNVLHYQSLLISHIAYSAPISVFGDIKFNEKYLSNGAISVLGVSGIANPKQFDKHIKGITERCEFIHFKDHHNFSIKDIDNIISKFKIMLKDNPNSYIFVTEKDAARLRLMNFPSDIKERIFAIPIKVVFSKEHKDTLIKHIDDVILNHNKPNNF